MRLAVVAIAWLCCACIDENLVRCGNGIACPVDYTCDLIRSSCISPEQQAVCAGQADGTACEAGTLTGACHDGVCQRIGCANFIIDNGEQCDDGNETAGDGCNADCTSDETCGNGVLDPGEECEDGNVVSRDRCDSRCITEQAVYTRVALSPDYVYAAAYDIQRQRLVLPTYNGGVWEFGDGAWTVTATEQTEQNVLLIHYDTARKQIVRVEPFEDGNGDTRVRLHTWDGVEWTAVPVTRRVGESGAVVLSTFDPPRDQTIVLVEDYTADPLVLRAFALDAANTLTALPDVPEVLTQMSIARDPQNNRLVLLGRSGPTWKEYMFNGTAWLTGTPPPRAGSSWSLAASGGELHALHRSSGAIYARRTGAWVELPNHLYAPSNGEAVLFHDHSTGELAVSLGARVGHFRAGAWVDTFFPTNSGAIVARPEGALLISTSDTAAHRMWSVDADGLTQLAVANIARPSPACTYSSGRSAVVCQNNIGEVSAFDGAAWTSLPALTLPEVPSTYTLAYDPEQRRVIAANRLSGAMGTIISALADDGSAWSSVNAPASVRAAQLQSLAWDARNANLIVTAIGGTTATSLFELDGDTWTTLPIGPTGRLHAAPDARRGTALLVSTSDETLFERHADTFSKLNVDIAHDNYVRGVAYADATGELYIYGNAFYGGVVYIRRYDSPTPMESCEAGADVDGDGLAACDDPDCYWACSRCPPLTSCRF